MQDFSSSSIHKYILIDRCNQFNCIIIFWPWPYYQTLMLLFLIFWIKISFIDAIEEFLLNFNFFNLEILVDICMVASNWTVTFIFFTFRMSLTSLVLILKEREFQRLCSRYFINTCIQLYYFLNLTFYLALTLCISILYTGKFKFRNSSHLRSVPLSQHNCVVIPACEQVDKNWFIRVQTSEP